MGKVSCQGMRHGKLLSLAGDGVSRGKRSTRASEGNETPKWWKAKAEKIVAEHSVVSICNSPGGKM